MGKPVKKELLVCGHQPCPECERIGYNKAIEECEAYYKRKEYIQELIDSGRVGVDFDSLNKYYDEFYETIGRENSSLLKHIKQYENEIVKPLVG